MGVRISLNVSELSQSKANNTSTVSVTATLIWNGGSFNNNQRSGYVKIDGVRHNFSDNFNWNGQYNSGSKQVWSGTQKITHDEDGTKTLICTAFYSSDVSSGDVTDSVETILTPIPRPSGITEVKDTSFGSRCNVTWTPMSSDVYNRLKFTMGGWSGQTSVFRPGTAASYTYTGYIIPLDAAVAIPSATRGMMRVTLYSYSDSSGGNQIGASSKDFTVTLPENVKPYVHGYSANIDNSLNSTVAGWGIAVVGYTKVRIIASSSGAYGSTVSRFNISGGYDELVSGSYLDYTGGTISSSGSKTFTITCTDSRGRTSDPVVTDAIDFVRYTAPKIEQFTADKNAYGNACLTAIYSYDSMGGKNTAAAMLEYRQSGATADTWYTIGQIHNNQQYVTDIKPSETVSYTFRVVLTDALGNTVDKITFLSTAKVLLDFKSDGDGFGVGKISERPGMEVAMDTTFFGEVKIGTQTLSSFISEVMKILPQSMYGEGDPPAGAEIGQIYFKKLKGTRDIDGAGSVTAE